MKCSVLVVVALFALVGSVPVPASDDLQLVQIPLQGNKEIDILSLDDNAGQSAERNKRTIGILRELFPELSKVAIDGADADSVDMAALSEKLESISRVVRQTQQAAASEADANAAVDPNSAAAVAAEVLQTAASDSSAQAQLDAAKAPGLDELSLDDEVVDDNRNKRFLNFGFGSSGGNGGSSGGSGNFLFDIIRLVSGSSGTEQTDEKENAPEADAGKDAGGYTEGIPGPVTRLIVLANRGISNLIQDLILRIAATSERVVNFKARLITSLI